MSETTRATESTTGVERRAVWLHVHVPKAGGSTLRQLLHRNFGQRYYNSTSLLETKQYTREDVSEIIRCHPQFACISDHKFSLDLPYDHAEADVYALCFVRDAVERFVSRYFFHRHFEEVACLAQRLTFREFANLELVEGFAHPQTNSQIRFLNGGLAHDNLEPIEQTLTTGRVFLFPIERFDEAALALERMYPSVFPDLSYVRANVSVRDGEVAANDIAFIRERLQADTPLLSLAHRELDLLLGRAFPQVDERAAALAEFRDRCQRRFHNFHAPAPREPLDVPAAADEFSVDANGTESVPDTAPTSP